MKNRELDAELTVGKITEAIPINPTAKLRPKKDQTITTNLEELIKKSNQSLNVIKERLDHLTDQLRELQQQMIGLGQATAPDHFEVDAFSSPSFEAAVDQWPKPPALAKDPSASVGNIPPSEHHSKQELKKLFDQIQQEIEDSSNRLSLEPPAKALSHWVASNPSTHEMQKGTSPADALEKVVPELIEPPVETDVNTAWYHEAPDYDVDRYVNRVVESLHNLSTNQSQPTTSQPTVSNDLEFAQRHRPRSDRPAQTLREFTPMSVPPESSSRLLAMRELANAATCFTAKLSGKRKKFTFWIRSISGLSALTGCFIWITFSSHHGDFSSITGGLLMLIGLATGIFLQRKTGSPLAASIPQTARARAILESAKS